MIPKIPKREMSSYNALTQFLRRKGVGQCRKLTSLLIDKFVKCKSEKDYKEIYLNDLKEYDLISEEYPTLNQWRQEMKDKRILICMAGYNELQKETPDHRANMYKPGDDIMKYIEKAKVESLGVRMNKVETKVDNVDFEVRKLRAEMSILSKKYAKHLIETFPPDTPERRQIVLENIDDPERCIDLLSEESDRNPRLLQDIELNDKRLN